MVGDNHLGSMETEGRAGSIPVISEKKFFYHICDNTMYPTKPAPKDLIQLVFISV